MKSTIVKITCLTDMSVGNGESNYSVIDNEVSKDTVSSAPTIPSSGLKGAFRQFFEDNSLCGTEKLFGSDVRSSSSAPGSLKFIDARILGQPVRASGGNLAFYLAVPTVSYDAIGDVYEIAGVDYPEKATFDTTKSYSTADGVSVEGISLEKYCGSEEMKFFLDAQLGKDKWVILGEKDYRTRISLPVAARNQLDDNGKSINLWYEEIVPHKAVFVCAVLGPENDIDIFAEAIDKKVIQFGGNASIGRGFCKTEIIESK